MITFAIILLWVVLLMYFILYNFSDEAEVKSDIFVLISATLLAIAIIILVNSPAEITTTKPIIPTTTTTITINNGDTTTVTTYIYKEYENN